MRLDKFLKVSRLIKRRTVAKDICEGDKIQVNGRIAKPCAEVKPGDVLLIELGNHRLEVRVKSVANTVRADEAHLLYEVLREEHKTGL
ncbi:MAG: RNA-binding S4 domain-containing protein [Desulfitobacteriaceae bacterium]|nr:RNA-binding S4 domain-containing protein [Desulfitobacteriaceae bacterium]MDI6878056.1 RNA-binding S4 domain-containing protein [Desulfitobacteriaceae bacterium]MDI6913926.1 RNA-binding S4 domain-containing protein [Desulfitobacteriaceae bacterium]